MIHFIVRLSFGDGINWVGKRFADSIEDINDLICRSRYSDTVYSIDKCPGCNECLLSGGENATQDGEVKKDNI